MSKMIPLVIHHVRTCPLYLEKCVKINAIKNPVFLISDNNTLHLSGPNITHIDVNSLKFTEADIFEKYFVNYSTNDAGYEYLCFERFFILKQLMLQHNLEKIVYVDSDCIILENMNDLAKNISCAFSINTVPNNPFHMVSCIHNSILTVELCDAFIQLCSDIYINKSKFHLIEGKIKWHKDNDKPGGICDMTLCHLITEHKMVDNIIDMNEVFEYDGEPCVFDHNISIPYGFDGEDTYVMNNGIKQLTKSGGKHYGLTKSGKRIRFLSIHFSGGRKVILQNIEPTTFYS